MGEILNLNNILLYIIADKLFYVFFICGAYFVATTSPFLKKQQRRNSMEFAILVGVFKLFIVLNI